MKILSFVTIVLVLCVRVSEAQVAGTDSASSPQSSVMNEPKSSNVDDKQEDREDKPIGYYNLKTKTFGGQQFWTDVRYVGGWRIQNNSETEHYRLIDPKDVRHAWGNRLHCDQVLDKAIVDGDAKLCSGKVVIVLHGLIRTSNSMQSLADYLKNEGNYEAINFEYASTRKRVGEHAIALRDLINGLGPNVTEISFVGHSLGNIVVRRFLGDNIDPSTGKQSDSRLHRAVMIGPPNQGSRMARLLKSSRVFSIVAGASGSELSRSWDELEPTLATPDFEFGIIAGGQPTEKKLSNFVLKGKDDFTVSVEETKLDGAHDFLVKPLFHSTMMKQAAVHKATLSFLEHGYFVSEKDRNPLLVKQDSTAAPNGENRSGR